MKIEHIMDIFDLGSWDTVCAGQRVFEILRCIDHCHHVWWKLNCIRSMGTYLGFCSPTSPHPSLQVPNGKENNHGGSSSLKVFILGVPFHHLCFGFYPKRHSSLESERTEIYKHSNNAVCDNRKQRRNLGRPRS